MLAYGNLASLRLGFRLGFQDFHPPSTLTHSSVAPFLKTDEG